MISQEQVLEILETNGALLTGHFLYTSGMHGPEYVDKDRVFPNSDDLSMLCCSLAESFANSEVEVVVAPAEGAIGMAQWVAWYLRRMTGREVQAAYASKNKDGFWFKGAFISLIQDHQVLLLEDILTTGGSALKVVNLVRETGGTIVGLGALVNRGTVTVEAIGNIPRLVALANLDLVAYPPADCPLCKENIPISNSAGKGR